MGISWTRRVEEQKQESPSFLADSACGPRISIPREIHTALLQPRPTEAKVTKAHPGKSGRTLLFHGMLARF